MSAFQNQQSPFSSQPQQNPFGSNQQQQQSQQQPQQQNSIQGEINNIFNQASNPLTQAAGNIMIGKAGSILQKADPNLLTQKIFSSNSRYYFDVDSNYVINKLKILFLPFLAKGQWEKAQDCGLGHQGFLNPVQELHAPDLYIPLMSLMTFTLISCLSVGIGDEFKPEIIQQNLSKSIFICILEILLFKLGFFLINIQSNGFLESFLDLLSHLNYRFVHLTIILISKLILGSYITTVVLLYLFGCSVLFVYKTLQRYQSTVGEEDFKQKILLILSGVQLIFSYILLSATGAY